MNSVGGKLENLSPEMALKLKLTPQFYIPPTVMLKFKHTLICYYGDWKTIDLRISVIFSYDDGNGLLTICSI